MNTLKNLDKLNSCNQGGHTSSEERNSNDRGCRDHESTVVLNIRNLGRSGSVDVGVARESGSSIGGGSASDASAVDRGSSGSKNDGSACGGALNGAGRRNDR